MTDSSLPGIETLEERPSRATPDTSSAAVGVLCIAVLLWFGFQTSVLIRDRKNLTTAHTNQEQLLQQANRVRTQVEALARGTLQLAQQGNAGATLIVEQLARRGITISPGGTPPGGPPAAAPSK
jgi:hypothetical protein